LLDDDRAGDPAFPPEANWLPGQICQPQLLFRDNEIHVAAAGLSVFPDGVLVDVQARLRRLLPPDEQRDLRSQVGALFHDGPDHRGPHLRPASSERTHDELRPWRNSINGRLVELGFWAAGVSNWSADLELVFWWPDRDIQPVGLSYLAADIDAARSAAVEIWNTPENAEYIAL
jgi:hypothetical protein